MTILEDLKSGRLVVVPPVSVKPLEWSEEPTSGVTTKWQAESNFGRYSVHLGMGNAWTFTPPQIFDGKTGFHSPAKAKAAAQADYEAHILSALTDSPSHTSGLIALVEGMERERDEALKLYLDGVMARRALAAEAEVDAQDLIIIAAKRERDAAEADLAAACENHAHATIAWERERGLREAAEAKADALSKALSRCEQYGNEAVKLIAREAIKQNNAARALTEQNNG